MNLNQTCNAYWDGSAVNFFKSGGGCSNTGELPTVFLHEVGHGLDSNDGSPSSTVGSSESYADINAILTTHESCIGVNFIPGQQCSGYGNPCTNCTGIRDADYTKHSYSTTPAKPSQLSGYTGYHCSTSSSYPGPCGYEGHCESYIMSEVGWDLAARDLPAEGYDQATSWMIADRLFFLSRSTSGDAYSCPSLSGANGCGTSNWFTTFRAVDDDDGNLSNGTPHAAAIYAAFNRHGIACTSVTNTSYSACPSIGQPTLTATAGSGSVALSWTGVTNASAYKVLRNEFSVNAGMTIVATVSGTSYTDAAVAPGLTYYYSVQAVGSNDACFGPLASVKSAVPGGGTPPATYSISGAVSGDVASNVTMTLSGAGTGTTTTNSSGNYSFSGLTNGTYTVTPSLSGYTFSPSSQSVTINGANRTGINFTATASSGGNCNALTASYNSTYHCPAVTAAGKSVTAPSSLLQCRGTTGESNAPNTINGCADGNSGSCHSDESIEAITIATSDGTSCLAPGQQVTVSVDTYCYSTADYVTFFYATNASSPSWTKVGSTQQAPGSGYKTFTWTFTLSGTAGTMQAVRAQMTYNADPGSNACTSGNYNDRDDLAFMTASTTPTTYTISGTVSGDVANGVTMTLSGADTGTATTNSSGNYSFSGLANGTYTVTPSLSGYTFSPSSQSVTINGANRTGINFTATAIPPATYSISGTVSGDVANGVTMTLSGADTGTATTNSSGNYSFSGLANGTYTVTPSLSGYTFSPSSQSVTINGANRTGINFTATAIPPATYTISGTVSGDVANGVAMTLSGAGTGTMTTNSSGNYSFSGLANGTYTVTPSLSGYTFTPSSQSVTISGANRTGINFTSTASGGSCSALTASYNSTYHCPAVTTAGKSVTAPSSLLQCVGSGKEANAPNTINGCADGTSGTCHSDESIEAITIATSDGTSCLAPGQQVTVTVSTYCYSTADYVTFFYSTNASSPSWTKVGSTQQAPGSGYKTFTWALTLSGTAGTMQAVRAQMTYNKDPGTNACYSGNYNDRDDLAFMTATTAPPATYSISGTVSGDVANGVTMTLSGAGTGTATTNSSGTYSFSGLANGTYTVTPSLSGYTFTPSSQSVTISGANRTGINFTSTASGGNCNALTASYNSTYHCPAVTTAGKSVTAPSSLLQCRGTTGESNAPNTINGCADGNSGSCHSDESIEAITIATSDGTSCLAPGQQVTVTVSAYCWGTADYVTFFYATNASSPSWTKVGSTQQATGSGYKTFTWTFTLSGTAGTMQAVRAQMTYNADPGTNACSSGSYNDRDDLAFRTGTTALGLTANGDIVPAGIKRDRK